MDLGSNSFHMVVAEERQGQLFILDRLREMVRLAAGLDARGNLSATVEKNALDCLQRFGQRLRELSSENVSAVGTNTFRAADNASEFLDQAEQALGHPIDIISGVEEARLIYNGVVHSLKQADERRLVVDIGGGSTELILGRGLEPRERESLFMGCVSMTRRFFANGKINSDGMEKAVLAGRVEQFPGRRFGGYQMAPRTQVTAVTVRQRRRTEPQCSEHRAGRIVRGDLGLCAVNWKPETSQRSQREHGRANGLADRRLIEGPQRVTHLWISNPQMQYPTLGDIRYSSRSEDS